MKVGLICCSGISTGIIVERMKRESKPEDVIMAYDQHRLEEALHVCDVLLLGPQVRFQYETIQRKCQEMRVSCEMLNHDAYQKLDGQAVYNQALALYLNVFHA